MTSGDVIAFGSYRLIPAERRLLKGEDAVSVGSRAIDVLIALAESAGEVVGQRELLARAWPNVIVSDASLRVTIAGLRRALGDNEDVRYIANVTGRGYCFVAPVERLKTQLGSLRPAADPTPVPKHNLPPSLVRMVGRDDAVEALSTLLASRRFVSLVGPGGMGKTTVAVSVAHAMLGEFGDEVYFVDLVAVTDASLVASVVARVLGAFGQEQDPLPGLLAFLDGRRLLLVLDNCEHVIDAAASLAERLHRDAPHVHILTTSREALRVEGEHVYLLTPLGSPVAREGLTAAEALASPAVQLFMERAFASGHHLALTDPDAATVATMCGRLDGIALAIELAASRVGAYGLQATADLLSNRFKLLWQGRRSAPPRHQTLTAMLDWSFNLLSARDRRVLGSLSVFIGPFTLEAAQAVAADERTEAMEVADATTSLIDKSLISVVSIDGATHYRLLDSTLAFAAEKLASTAEAAAVAKRHALYYTKYLSQNFGRDAEHSGTGITVGQPYIGTIRTALEWSFSASGDVAIGVRLAAAVAPLFFEVSSIVECVRWCDRGLAVLPDSDVGTAAQLTLLSFSAASTMFTRGNSDKVRSSLEEALSLAEKLNDQRYQMHLLVGLSIFSSRIGDFVSTLTAAQRGFTVTQAIGAPGVVATGESVLGVAYHLAGDQVEARRHCERGLAQAEVAGAAQVFFFGYDHEVRALIALARCYWLMGLPDRAASTAWRAIEVASERDHPINLCMTLIYTSTVFLWRGDLDEAQRLIQRLTTHAARHSLGPYRSAGLALSGELCIARGDLAAGVELLRQGLAVLQAEKHHALTPALHATLAEGLMNVGQIDEAAEVAEAGLRLSRAFGETLNVPELLRVRGEIWLRTSPADLDAAEQAFQRSLAQAKAQRALSLELRSAISLSRLWSSQGRSEDAADLLDGLYTQFAEGRQTADLRLAGQVLSELRCSRAGHVPASGPALAAGV
ncbi:winged helix-turn-helix domain-containing protein [Acidisoma cellulosilytica]|uniref:Winged helix-turn-helix domain-containing protein n=1 Tax=Acidisoma cellulosilyticum TaxID=2802395 RepID=A0A964E5T0_9PROT|nr:winged helix-turn-helix domain-containing protein [Acidisoma cellulosilyticum]MCB8883005.1 winged helix-turn-helix domain-containing protein [Acidisoma cellulosilyticum]